MTIWKWFIRKQLKQLRTSFYINRSRTIFGTLRNWKASAQSTKWIIWSLSSRFSRIWSHYEIQACFIAGTFALQSSQELNETTRSHYLKLAEEIAHTCHESYRKTVTGIGPEAFRFTQDAEAQPTRMSESYYILRPEAIEAWFYLWRVTGNEKYRDWCWEAAQAIERHCRVEAGYSGIRNVNSQRVFWIFLNC